MGHWNRTMGENGDLADVVLGAISLASVDHGLERLSLDDYYRIFVRLREDFPDLIPELFTTNWEVSVHSKVLSDALEKALRLGLDIANPRFFYIEVKKQSGIQNIRWLEGRTGGPFIQKLKPLAHRLVELSKEKVPVRA